MDSSKNGRWNIPFKKFCRLRVKISNFCPAKLFASLISENHKLEKASLFNKSIFYEECSFSTFRPMNGVANSLFFEEVTVPLVLVLV